jgi:hypothetical protein
VGSGNGEAMTLANLTALGEYMLVDNVSNSAGSGYFVAKTVTVLRHHAPSGGQRCGHHKHVSL